jgi:cell division protein FtsZ
MKEDLLPFDMKEKEPSIIKVIGVGGGGSNAVKNMHRQGITGVDFIICNTDKQALDGSSIDTRIQLGPSLTEGLGAGSKPERGRESAIESIEEVKKHLDDRTKMVFITAGMGGGTGTGAAPVIAEIAEEMEKLTVGIVTIPFRYEGKKRIKQAIEGIREMNKHVDALLVVNNEKLREMYGDLEADKAFEKADDVLTVAAKGIAEIITKEGYINVDFADVQTVMSNSGIALMGSGKSKGDNRAVKAVEDALASPLLDNNDINGAKNLLINIAYSSSHKATMDEIAEINEIVQDAAGNEADLIFGSTEDNSLEEYIAVTIIATGFGEHDIPSIYSNMPDDVLKSDAKSKIVYDIDVKEEADEEPEELEEPEARVFDLSEDDISKEESFSDEDNSISEDPFQINDSIFTEDRQSEKERVKTKRTAVTTGANITTSEGMREESRGVSSYIENLTEYEDIPAFQRRNVQLGLKEDYSSEEYSRLTLGKEGNGPIIRKNNQYLHDKSD